MGFVHSGAIKRDRCAFLQTTVGLRRGREWSRGRKRQCESRRTLSMEARGEQSRIVPPDMLKGVNTKISRLLSIDGGGIRGVIPARFLVEVENEVRVQLRKRYNNDPRYNWEFPVHLADYFDCLAGTSTGAILATYFACKGANAQEKIIFGEGFEKRQDLYKKLRNKKEMPTTAGSAESVLAVYLMTASLIFPPRGIPLWPTNGRLAIPKTLKQLFMPVYSAKGVESMLKSAFGDLKLSDLKKNLIVPSYSITENAAMSYFSGSFDGMKRLQGKATVNNSEDGAQKVPGTNVQKKRDSTSSPSSASEVRPMAVHADPTAHFDAVPDLSYVQTDFLLWEVVRASTSAPLYFPAATVTDIGEKKSYKMVDGGVTSCNPILQGLLMMAEMKSTKDPKNDLAVLSFGCGKLVSSMEDKAKAGLIGWGGGLMGIFLSGTSWMTQAMVDEFFYRVVGMKPPHYLRIQKTVIDDGSNDELVKALNNMDGSSDAQLQELLKIAERDETDMEMVREWVRTVIFDPTTAPWE